MAILKAQDTVTKKTDAGVITQEAAAKEATDAGTNMRNKTCDVDLF